MLLLDGGKSIIKLVNMLSIIKDVMKYDHYFRLESLKIMTELELWIDVWVVTNAVGMLFSG